jgi:hypothetical protein
MIEAGGPSTSEFQECYPKSCARPTGGSHGLTTEVPRNAERGKGMGRARYDGEKTGAARGSIEAGTL